MLSILLLKPTNFGVKTLNLLEQVSDLPLQVFDFFFEAPALFSLELVCVLFMAELLRLCLKSLRQVIECGFFGAQSGFKVLFLRSHVRQLFF